MNGGASYLSLGQTEKEEKAARRALMDEYGCSELDAAYKVAESMDRKRGIPARSAGGGCGMMALKYPEPVVCAHHTGSSSPSLFSLPPQGPATVSVMHGKALDTLCRAITARLPGPVTLTVHPHRIGSRNSVALHLRGRLGRCIDLLVTVTGNTLWPLPEEYVHPRWYITVPDAADAVYLLLYLNNVLHRPLVATWPQE